MSELETNDIRALTREMADMAVRPVAEKDEFGNERLFVGNMMREVVVRALNPKLPDDIAADQEFVEPDSFAGYVNLFKTASTILFASLEGNATPLIEAAIDYHNGSDGTKGGTPNRCNHHATLLCPFDPDFVSWKAKMDEPLSQAELSHFLEDMMHTIATPPGANLLEAINDLNMVKDVTFKSYKNDRDGSVRLTYDEEVGNSGSLVLPEEIGLVLPIFRGAGNVSINVKLRIRLDRGKCSFLLVAPMLHKTIRDEFRNIVEDAATITERPAFYRA